MPRQSISLPLALAITAGWIIITVLVMLRHEIWLDEAQHWLLAKDSNTIGDLLVNMRYEGHPPLWNLLLFGVSRISGSILAMQILHLCFAGGTVFLILKYAPFPLWVKLILPFTYFFGYEYAVISRNYAPAVFFIVLACVFASDLRKNLLKIAICMSIAALFHIYAGIVALSVMGYLVLTIRKENTSFRRIALPIAIFLGIFLLTAWWIQVPADHFIFHSHEVFALRRVGTMLRLPFNALMHFPELCENYWWNSNILMANPDWVKSIIALLFWFVPVLVLQADKRIMLLYLIGASVVSGAMFLTPMPIAVRHAGMIALLFFLCLWLKNETHGIRTKLFSIAVAAILIVQVGAYFVTMYKEWKYPFSESKNVVSLVQENYPETPVCVYPHFLGPSVSAYLGKPVFYAEFERAGSFTDWREVSFGRPHDEELVIRCRAYMASEHIDSLVLLVYNGDEYNTAVRRATRVKGYYGAAVMAENYDVYILKRE